MWAQFRELCSACNHFSDNSHLGASCCVWHVWGYCFILDSVNLTFSTLPAGWPCFRDEDMGRAMYLPWSPGRASVSLVFSFCSFTPPLLLSSTGDFFLKSIFIFLEQREERERNIDQLPLTHLPLRTWPTSQACALTGNLTSNPSVYRLALNPREPHQPGHGNIDLMLAALCVTVT